MTVWTASQGEQGYSVMQEKDEVQEEELDEEEDEQTQEGWILSAPLRTMGI